MERLFEKQKDIYMCFDDFEKALDTVRHEKLVNRLVRYGVDGAELRLLKELYWGQRTTVRVGDEKCESKNIKRDVRQGCVFSPDFFSRYTQIILEEMSDLPGIKIGGQNINNIR